MLSVIADHAELEALRPEWSELWRNDPRATPFQSPEWLLAWWRHLFQGGQLWTVVQRRDDKLVSLLPAFRYGDRCQHLTLIGTGVTDYLDLLGEPIESIPGDWEDAGLEELRPGSPLLALGAGEACSVCPVASLPATIDPKLAVDIHRASNRLHRAGAVKIERIESLDSLIELHRARWVERNEEGMLADERLKAFHREVAQGFAALGMLRLYEMTLDSRAIAAVYAFTHRGRTYGYLTGFDPALTKLSPGTVLLAHAFEEATQEGVLEFDFLREQEAYKYRWGAEDRSNYKVRLPRDRSSRDRCLTR